MRVNIVVVLLGIKRGISPPKSQKKKLQENNYTKMITVSFRKGIRCILNYSLRSRSKLSKS